MWKRLKIGESLSSLNISLLSEMRQSDVKIIAKGKTVNIPMDVFGSTEHYEMMKKSNYQIDVDQADLRMFVKYIMNSVNLNEYDDVFSDETKMKIGHMSYLFGHNNIHKVFWMIMNQFKDIQLLKNVIDQTIDFKQSIITKNKYVSKKLIELIHQNEIDNKLEKEIKKNVDNYENWMIVMIEKSEKIKSDCICDFIDKHGGYLGKKLCYFAKEHKPITDQQHPPYIWISSIDEKYLLMFCPLTDNEIRNLTETYGIAIKSIDEAVQLLG
jgi:hypothetical protein